MAVLSIAGSAEAWLVAQVKALIQLGADIACQVAGGRSRPVSNWMCAGSTPLHLACARGFPAIAAVLLDAQTETPGVCIHLSSSNESS